MPPKNYGTDQNDNQPIMGGPDGGIETQNGEDQHRALTIVDDGED